MAVIADMLPEYSQRAAANSRDHREEWLQTFIAARFGACHRKGYVIERIAQRSAVARAPELPTGVWAAVRCPACAIAELERKDDASIHCAACGHIVARERNGAYDLRSPSGRRARRLSPVNTTASVRALLTPDWERPQEWLPILASYVAAEPDSGHALCLDATASPLGLHTVTEMLSVACEAVRGGRSAR